MDALDRSILATIQADLPLTERPFDALAERLDTDPDEVLARTRRMLDEGVLRRVGPVYDSGRLGYRTTLVAARVPGNRLQDVAARISELPGVTHNYEREGEYNLWFTLAARLQSGLKETLAELSEQTGVCFHALPALTRYKIRATFSPNPEANRDPSPPRSSGVTNEASAELSEADKAIVRHTQGGLPVRPEPLAPVAEATGLTAAEVVTRMRKWLDTGVIRRFGAIAAHRRLGYAANGMAVFAVPEERMDEAGRLLAKQPDVTHCYRRPPLPDFPFSLYAMLHGADQPSVEARAAALTEQIGATSRTVLYSVREFKKTSPRYFV